MSSFKQSYGDLDISKHTLFLALAIFDKHMATVTMDSDHSVNHLTLLLLICIGIASKFVDGTSLPFEMLSPLAQKSEVANLEIRILRSLNYELLVPTLLTSLNQVSSWVGIPQHIVDAAADYLEKQEIEHGYHTHLNTLEKSASALKYSCKVYRASNLFSEQIDRAVRHGCRTSYPSSSNVVKQPPGICGGDE
ncbi:unnamed protein product [Heterosigma akashiwo]